MNKNFLYWILTLFISTTILFFGCGGGGGTPTPELDPTVVPQSAYKWTYMVYLGADNNLSSAGIKDITEMAKVGSNQNVAIVVQAEFSPTYTSGVLDTTTKRFLVQKGTAASNLNAATNIGDVDMGSDAALTDFIKWAANNYPADHYALVLWDHGAGWKSRASVTKSSLFRGAIQDETSGSFMSLPNLAAAVRNAGVEMDIINFDACLMAMYEVAYELKDLADFLVFSEETEPGDGDPYDTILTDLVNSPDMSARELSSTIVYRYDEFYTSYVAQYPGQLTTKSAVDLSMLTNLDAAVCDLGQALMADPTSAAIAMAARSNTQDYTYSANHDLYDLASYIAQSAPDGDSRDAAGAIMTTLDDMVVESLTNPDNAVSQNAGLAIYFPFASETNSEDLEDYSLLSCNTAVRQSQSGSWGEFVEWEIQQSGGSTGELGDGGYSLKVEWTTPSGAPCDADLDLWVVELEEAAYAPWMGQTTPNGTFSPDSLVSGESQEHYQANASVQAGWYDFFVQYYKNGSSCNRARVELFFNGQSLGWARYGSFIRIF